MNRKWVVNASPLIALAKISHVSLLYDLCVEMIIPDGVAQEVNDGPVDDPAKSWLQGEGGRWVQVVGRVDAVIAAWDLGLGEGQVLSWAYTHPGYEAIVDDRAARNCALSLGIQFRGTLGVILLAKKEGRVPQVNPLFDQLIETGFRIDPEVLKDALRLVNE